MIKCEYYPNHNICKRLNSCEFWIPINKTYSDLLKELSFEFKRLKELNQSKKNYFKVLNEIYNLKYTRKLCIKGSIVAVPEINALGEYILTPQDVIVGLNYASIDQEIADTMNIIRELRKKENDILRILKKRADRYD